MKTFYVDVYFLINFTVDILALYLAVRVAHLRTGIMRVVLCALIGAAVAVADVFLESKPILRVLIFSMSLLVMTVLITRRAGVRRRLKFLALFFTSMLLLGGAVGFGYSALESLFYDFGEVTLGGENRKALILSLLVLLSIGVIKFLIMIFSDMLGEKSVKVSITIADTTVQTEAMLDSGNLVKDPMNMHPVLFIKPSLALRLVPRCVAELNDLDLLDEDYRKRIRLIPVTKMNETHVMTGVRPDRVVVTQNNKHEELDFTIAIDKEGGTYGGFEALAPLAAINDAF